MTRVRVGIAACAAGGAGACFARGWGGLPSASVVGSGLVVALLALAVVNVVRTVAPVGTLLGPLVLAVAAAATLTVVHRPSVHPSWALVAGSALTVVTAAVVLSAPATGSGVWAFVWVRRAVRAGPMPEAMSVAAVLGSCLIDLGGLQATASQLSLRCILIGGHVRLVVPEGWDATLDSGSWAAAVTVDDRDRSLLPPGAPVIVIHLRAFAGGLVLRRR